MRDHNFFDGFARKNKMVPVGYIDTKYGRVLLADSCSCINENGKLIYRTGYAIQRAGLDFGNFNDYEINETGSSHSERFWRLNEALNHATESMRWLDQSGYFDDGRKQDFSPKP